MDFFHGVRKSERDTALTIPVPTSSAISVVIGTAPIHMANMENVNKPILTSNYSSAVMELGFSNDFKKYTLCEFIKSQFVLYNVSPVVFINVYDPNEHYKTVTNKVYTIKNKKVVFTVDTIGSTLELRIKNKENTIKLKENTDYVLTYDEEHSLVANILDSGNIPVDTVELYATYNEADLSKVDYKSIIGGVDINTGEYKGLELVDRVFPKFRIIPGFIVAPGWSHNPTVAAVMRAKAANINGLFTCRALVDIDVEANERYTQVPSWKNDNNYIHSQQVACWACVKMGSDIYHMSTHIAGLAAQVDNSNNNVPYESPSNKPLQINGACLKDGTEVYLDLTQANYLNANGITTALNFTGGWVAWGNTTATYPNVRDVKDYMLPVGRMFDWIGNTLILTYWERVDKPITRRLIDSVVDSINIWLNGLVSMEYLLGGRVEFRSDENQTMDLISGKIKFRIFITPPSPAQEIEFILEYDTSYLSILAT